MDLEKKILEKLKQAVLDKDKELNQKKEAEELKKATKEALAEMTSLSNKEVERIAQQIREEEEAKAKKRKKIITITISSVVFVAIIILYQYYQKLNPPKLYKHHETFETTTSGWNIIQEYTYKKQIKNGKYIMDYNHEGWCYWDDIPVELPENYSIELTSKWIRGIFKMYGLMLFESDDNHIIFQLRGDGAASINERKAGEWLDDIPWKTKKTETKKNIQRIDVQNGKASCYLNNNFFMDYDISHLDIKTVGFQVCNKQYVEFENLIIRELKNGKPGKLILADNFVNADNGWEPKEKLNKQTYFKDGMYFVQMGKKETCYFSYKYFNLKDSIKSENFDISIKTKWIEGEQNDYGLTLMQSTVDFVDFQMQNDGGARYVTYIGSDYNTINSFTKTPHSSNGDNFNTILIKIREREFEYFVNNQFIDRGTFSNKNYIKYIGCRVCGRQIVGFDDLIIEEK